MKNFSGKNISIKNKKSKKNIKKYSRKTKINKMIGGLLDFSEIINIIKRIDDNDPTLTKLTLSGYFNIPGKPSFFEIIILKILVPALIKNTNLTDLDISDNEMGIDGAVKFAKALKDNKSIITLNISSDVDYKLSDNNNNPDQNEIARLMLEGAIGDEGAIAIADALKNNNTLKNFNMSHNGIGDLGAAAIADALKNNNTLKNFNISNNRFNNQGAVKIAEALKVNSMISELDISSCNISDEGANAIAKALEENINGSQIKSLIILKGNNITREVQNKLKVVLRKILNSSKNINLFSIVASKLIKNSKKLNVRGYPFEERYKQTEYRPVLIGLSYCNIKEFLLSRII